MWQTQIRVELVGLRHEASGQAHGLQCGDSLCLSSGTTLACPTGGIIVIALQTRPPNVSRVRQQSKAIGFSSQQPTSQKGKARMTNHVGAFRSCTQATYLFTSAVGTAMPATTGCGAVWRPPPGRHVRCLSNMVNATLH